MHDSIARSPLARARGTLRHAGRLAAAGLATALLAGGVPDGAAAAPMPEILSNVAAGKCLDIPRASTRAGTRFQLYACHSEAPQSYLYDDGELRFFGTGQCLDAAGAGTTVGTRLIAYPCHGRANQRWDTPRETGLLVGRASGLCARATGTQSGAGVVLAECDPEDLAQVWARHLTGTTDVIPPTAPGDPTLADITCTSATLSWTASSDRGGVRTYGIYVDGTFATSTTAQELTAQVPLASDAAQVITLQAVDRAGNPSRPITRVEVVTPPCT